MTPPSPQNAQKIEAVLKSLGLIHTAQGTHAD